MATITGTWSELSGGAYEFEYTTGTDSVTTKRVTISGLATGLEITEEGANLADVSCEKDEASGDVTFKVGAATSILNTNNPDAGVTISVAGETGDTTTYKVAINITDLATEAALKEGTTPTVTITNGTATIKGTRKAYWSGTAAQSITYYKENTNATLATISGLKSDATTGVTIDDSTKTKIKITEDALAKDATTPASLSTTYSFTLALVEESTEKTELGFGDTALYWATKEETDGSTTATYQKHKEEGWTLTEGKTITYTAADTEHPDIVATITNLKSGLEPNNDGAIAGITVSGEEGSKTIQLTAAVLPDGNADIGADKAVTLTGEGYTLALEENVKQAVELAETPNLTLEVDENGTGTVKGDVIAYYTLNNETQKVTYTAAKNVTLATITGLSTDATSTAATPNVTFGVDKTITLALDALGDSNITLTPATGYDDSTNFGFKLALKDATGTPSALTKDKTDAKYWTFNNTTNTATYQYDTAKWTLAEGKNPTSITYTAKDGDSTTVATITNLKSDLTVNADKTITGIEVDNNKITLSESVLPGDATDIAGANAVTLTNGANQNYSLALDDDVKVEVELAETPNLTLEYDEENSQFNVKGNVIAYYTLGGENKQVTYTAAKMAETLATITGLTTTATTEGNDKTVTFDGTTIKLALGALGDSNITLTPATGYDLGLKLALDGATDNALTKAGDKFWTLNSTTHTASYQYNTAKWTLNKDTSITYNGQYGDPTVVAMITGIKSDLTLTASGEIDTTPAEPDPEPDPEPEPGSVDPPAGGDSTPEIDGQESSDEPETTATPTPTQGITVTEGASGQASTITLNEEVLGDNNLSLVLQNGGNYKLALAGATDNKVGFEKQDDEWKLTEVKDPTDSTKTISKTATYGYTTEKGWTLTNDTTITYTGAVETTLATIEGLSKEVTLPTEGDNKGKIGTTEDTTFKAGVSLDGTTIKLKEAVLSDGDVTLTNGTDQTYKLALDGSTKKNSDRQSIFGFGNKENSEHWDVEGTTATYQINNLEGWTLTDDTTITYTAEGDAPTTIATITNLSGDITTKEVTVSQKTTTQVGTGENESFKEGIKVESGKFTLSQNVLPGGEEDITDADKVVKVTNAAGQTYTLGLDNTTTAGGKVSTATTEATDWKIDGTTATYSNVKTAYYTLDEIGETVSYTAQVNVGDPLATITGLKSGLTSKSDGVYAADGTTQVIAVEAHTETPDDSTTEEDETEITKGTLTLKAGALNNTNVTIAGDYYELALDSSSVADPVLEGAEWTVSGTTATYKGKITTAGYDVSPDKSKIIYNGVNNNSATLLQITGLKSGLTKEQFTSGMTFDDNNNTITLKNTVLEGTTTIAIGSTGALKEAFTLELDSTQVTAKTIPTEDIAEKDIWEVSGSTTTTATYKRVKPAYYAVEDGKVVYHKEETLKTYATITGLAKGLTVAENGSSIYVSSDATKTAVIAIGTAPTIVTEDDPATEEDESGTVTTKGNITISQGALTTSNVALTSDYYTLAEDATKLTAPAPISSGGAATWTVSNGTATLKSRIDAGWTLNDEGTEITYTAAKTSDTLATVTGINSSITAETLNNKTGLYTYTPTTRVGVVTLTDDMLTNSDIEVTSGNYGDFTLDMNSESAYENLAAPSDKNVWAVDGTTVTYKTITPYHYLYAELEDTDTDTDSDSDTDTDTDTDDETKILYVAEEDQNTLLTITGLKSGLTTNDDREIDGIKFDTENNNKVILSANVLEEDATKTVELDGTGYTLALDINTDESLKVTETEKKLTLEYADSTATLYEGDKAGFKLDSNTVTYVPEAKGTGIATITGLKTGLTEEEIFGKAETTTGAGDGIAAGITYASGETKTITLSKSVLPAPAQMTLIQLTSDTYGLALKTGEDFSSAESKAWVDSGDGTYKLVKYTTRSYTLSGKTITYQPAVFDESTVYATITGLASDLEVDADGQIAGIKVASDGKITLSKNVLAGKNVTIEDASGDPIYTLALGNDVTAPTLGINNREWSIKSGTATLKETTIAGYELNNDGEVVYTPDSVTTTTISNLSSDVAVSTDKQSIGLRTVTGTGANATTTFAGIVVADHSTREVTDPETEEPTTEIVPGTITVSADCLNKKKATINSDYYNIVLDDSETKKIDVVKYAADPTWTKTSGKAVATYDQVIKAGYTQLDEKNIDYISKDKTNNLITISGLSKDLVLTADGKLSNGTVAITLTDPRPNQEVTITDPETQQQTTTTVDLPGTVKLNKDALEGATKVTLKSTDYEFADEVSTDVAEPTPDNPVWFANGKGTATYQYDTSAGWTVTDPKTLTYSAKKTTTLATLSGLNKSYTTETKGQNDTVTGTTLESIPGIEIEYFDEEGNTTTLAKAKTGVITLTNLEDGEDSYLTNANITLKTGKEIEYTLEVAEDANPQPFDDAKWYLSGTTATLKTGKKAGFEAKGDGKTLNYKAENPSETIVQLTGLKKGVTKEDIEKYITVNESEQTIEILNTTEQEKDESGNVVKDSSGNAVTFNTKDKILGTTNLVIKNSGDNEFTFVETEGLEPVDDPLVLTSNKGTITLTQKTSAGFEMTDDTTLTYNKEKNPTLVTIKGLDKELLSLTGDNTHVGASITSGNSTVIDTSTDKPQVTFNHTNKTVELNSVALEGKKKVTLTQPNTTDPYTFIFDSDGADSVATYAQNTTEWVTKGATASLKKYDKGYYELDSKGTTITYKAETKGTEYLKISGLKKEGVDLNHSSILGGDDSTVITLGADQLNGTNVSLKVSAKKGTADYNTYDAYTLAIGSNASASLTAMTITKTSADKGYDSNNGWDATKGILYGTLSQGYSVAANGKTITYLKKDKTKQKLATIKGLAKDASITPSDSKTSITPGEGLLTGTVALDANDLNKKDITITGSDYADYTLSLSGVTAPTASLASDYSEVDNPWNVKGSKANLQGAVSEGYTLAESGKSITYTKGTAYDTKKETFKTQTLATINGVKGSLDKNAVSGTTITLSNSNLNNKVTVTGGVFGFDFASDYNGGAIVGSAKADTIKVQGTDLTVTGGKGDDSIDLSGSRNIIVYAKGDGNDVIANFDSTDKIDMSKVALAESDIKKKGNDVVIKVGTGSITLQGGASLASVNIIDKNNKNGKAWDIPSSAQSPLLADENFATTDPILSDLVNSGNSNNSISDWSATKDITSLTPTNNIVAYGGDKK